MLLAVKTLRDYSSNQALYIFFNRPNPNRKYNERLGHWSQSFGCTQPGTNSSTITGRPFQQNVQTVFSFMDRLILQDNRITFDEFEKVMMQSDSNKDGLISLQEMGVAMDKLKLVPSSTATMIFGFIDVRPTDTYLNRSELQSLFSLFDSNNDGNIVLSEFMTSSNSLPSLVKMVG